MSKLKNKLRCQNFNFMAMFCIHDSKFGIQWRHTHEDYYELVIVRYGTATHCCEGQSTPIQAGDSFLLMPGQTHHYLCTSELGIYNLLFSADFVERTLSVFPRDSRLAALLDFDNSKMSAPLLKRLEKEQFFQIISLTEEMLEAQQYNNSRAQIIITANFMKVLLMLSDENTDSAKNSISPRNSVFVINCLLRKLNIQFAESWTLKQMADYCHLSVSHFRMIFKGITGMPPGVWLLRHRLHKASQMLLATQLEIREIALSCGFSDSNYFTRQFRRIIGTSPLKFRKSPQEVWPLTADTLLPQNKTANSTCARKF